MKMVVKQSVGFTGVIRDNRTRLFREANSIQPRDNNRRQRRTSSPRRDVFKRAVGDDHLRYGECVDLLHDIDRDFLYFYGCKTDRVTVSIRQVHEFLDKATSQVLAAGSTIGVEIPSIWTTPRIEQRRSRCLPLRSQSPRLSISIPHFSRGSGATCSQV